MKKVAGSGRAGLPSRTFGRRVKGRCSYQHGTFPPPPKLVLLDLKLPKMDGLEVLQVIREGERTKSIPVVILTSSKEQKPAGVGESKAQGAFDQFGETIRQIGIFWMFINQA